MTHPFEPLKGGLREAWMESGAAERLRKLRRAALATREALLADGPVLACQTHQLVTFPTRPPTPSRAAPCRPRPS